VILILDVRRNHRADLLLAGLSRLPVSLNGWTYARQRSLTLQSRILLSTAANSDQRLATQPHDSRMIIVLGSTTDRGAPDPFLSRSNSNEAASRPSIAAGC
jgi:hypothetical protein